MLEALRLRMCANGHLVIPVAFSNEREFTYRTLQTADGRIWLAAFTSHEEYAKCAPSQILTDFIDTFLHVCADNDGKGIIITPWENPFMLTKELIEMLLEADAQTREQRSAKKRPMKAKPLTLWQRTINA